MSRYVELNAPAILAQTPFDRATDLGIRCRIFYQDGVEEPESPITLIHRGSGHYSTTWIPKKAGEYSLSYEFFTDPTFTIESEIYEAGEDILNARLLDDDEIPPLSSNVVVGGVIEDCGATVDCGATTTSVTTTTMAIGTRTIDGRSTANVPWRTRR